MEASKLPGTEFEAMAIRMFKELGENFNSIKKDIKTRKKDKSELTNMKNNLQRFNSRADKAENQISYLEHKEAANTQSEQQKVKNPKK